MDCEQFRERLAEDPACSDAELDRHLAECPACPAYAARLTEAERRIQQALRFDVAAVKAAARAAPKSRGGAWAGIAAVLVAGLVLWTLLAPPSDEQLAFEVVAHWYHEPEAWTQSDVAISNVVLDEVLAGHAELDLGALAPITYAKACLVAGQWIPHLVLQGQQGPVMLLLLPERSLAAPMPLALPTEGLEGRMLPHDGGSIAVLGEDDEPLPELEQRVAEAVSWTI